ncbi:MAG: NAD-dependent epimerase/dehydratase family protein [Opitutaceae bacterium]|nr:NAD-dependent epimerase/dehydratase family protein [Cytophagales bacterium]
MLNNSQNILLLGGAGFLGTNISLKLLEEGHSITILDRSMSNALVFESWKEKAKLIKVDLLNFEEVRNVIRNNHFDTVIHLITNVIPGSSFSEFLLDSDVSIKMSFRLIEEIHAAGIKNFLYFSSGGTVYGNNGKEINHEDAPKYPISLYGWYKLAMEQYIQTYAYTHSLNYAILRPSNPYGRFQNLYGQQGFVAVAIGRILLNKQIDVWGDGNIIRDYIYVEDLAQIVSGLISGGFKNAIFNIGTGQGHSINLILKILTDITGKEINVVYTESRTVDVQTNILDIEAINNFLPKRFLPKTSIEIGIGQMWEWCIQNQKLVNRNL